MELGIYHSEDQDVHFFTPLSEKTICGLQRSIPCRWTPRHSSVAGGLWEFCVLNMVPFFNVLKMLQDGAPQLQVWFTNPINYSYIYHSKWVIKKKVYIIIYGGFEPPISPKRTKKSVSPHTCAPSNCCGCLNSMAETACSNGENPNKTSP